mgnify:CR=1 FL=1
MSQREQEILESVAKALPQMPDIKKGELLGYAKAMVDLKKAAPEQEKKEDTDD